MQNGFKFDCWTLQPENPDVLNPAGREPCSPKALGHLSVLEQVLKRAVGLGRVAPRVSGCGLRCFVPGGERAKPVLGDAVVHACSLLDCLGLGSRISASCSSESNRGCERS